MLLVRKDCDEQQVKENERWKYNSIFHVSCHVQHKIRSEIEHNKKKNPMIKMIRRDKKKS